MKNGIIVNKKRATTAVSRNGEARDLFKIGKVFNLKFCYICNGLVLVHCHFLKPRNVRKCFQAMYDEIYNFNTPIFISFEL